MRRAGFFRPVWTVAAAVAASLYGVGARAAAPPLLTPSQYQVDALALTLRNDPAVLAARQKVLASWQTLSLAQLPDGKATLPNAVNDLVYLALRSAVADPNRPQILWTEAPAYRIGKLQVPSGRGGHSPDSRRTTIGTRNRPAGCPARRRSRAPEAPRATPRRIRIARQHRLKCL